MLCAKRCKVVLSNKTDNEQPAEPAELYDFLYRDFDRIASYYAQIWNGRLLSVEESSTEGQQSEETLKGDVKVLSHESKTVSAYQFQNKRTIDMHDAATVDLLIRLAAQAAERGGLGLIKSFSGTCFFLDRNVLKFAGPAIDLALQQSPAVKTESSSRGLSRQQRRQQERKEPVKAEAGAVSSMKSLIAAIDMPSGFVLKVNGEITICGPIKESGLDQPISSILFRAGSRGLANTFVIGLEEELNAELDQPFSPIHEAQIAMANSFLPMLLPPDAIRVVPLAIYRKIPI